MIHGVIQTLRGWGLPLLEKELIEQAARKRTYIVRAVYATLFFGTAYILFYDTLSVMNSNSLAILGRGRPMFNILVGLQFAGIYLFVPALTCGIITQEKERSSLQLLFLTRLGPWTILFEKYLSRLIPALGFLLLSLPLLAFAYSLGGISPDYLAFGVWLLFISVLQMAALGLACSAYFRTTAAAFVASYLIGALMLFGPLLFWTLTGALRRNSMPSLIVTPFFGAVLFLEGNLGPFSTLSTLKTIFELSAKSVPILFSITVFLGLTRVFLLSRAFVPPRNYLQEVFKRLDRTFERLNQNRWTKGIVLVGDTASLPDTKPIAWRETTKRSLGQFRYLLRLLLVLEIPIVFLCLLMVIDDLGGGGRQNLLSMAVFLVWGIAVLIIAVHSASLIATEKSNQTLEVLCTTPLSETDIVHQKFQSVWRLIGVFLVPLFTLFGFKCWVHTLSPNSGWGYSLHQELGSTYYLACSVLTAGIYLPMFAWLSFLIGLKSKSQGRAIIGSLAAIVGWGLLPFLFCVAPVALLSRGTEIHDESSLILVASPISMIAMNEIGDGPRMFQTVIPLIVNCLIYGTALFAFRAWAFSTAQKAFGRSPVVATNIAELPPERVSANPQTDTTL